MLSVAYVGLLEGAADNYSIMLTVGTRCSRGVRPTMTLPWQGLEDEWTLAATPRGPSVWTMVSHPPRTIFHFYSLLALQRTKLSFEQTNACIMQFLARPSLAKGFAIFFFNNHWSVWQKQIVKSRKNISACAKRVKCLHKDKFRNPFFDCRIQKKLFHES